MNKIHVIDSHTGGEPTRIVIAGGPDLGTGPLAERLAVFREQHNDFRAAVVNESLQWNVHRISPHTRPMEITSSVISRPIQTITMPSTARPNTASR